MGRKTAGRSKLSQASPGTTEQPPASEPRHAGAVSRHGCHSRPATPRMSSCCLSPRHSHGARQTRNGPQVIGTSRPPTWSRRKAMFFRPCLYESRGRGPVPAVCLETRERTRCALRRKLERLAGDRGASVGVFWAPCKSLRSFRRFEPRDPDREPAGHCGFLRGVPGIGLQSALERGRRIGVWPRAVRIRAITPPHHLSNMYGTSRSSCWSGSGWRRSPA